MQEVTKSDAKSDAVEKSDAVKKSNAVEKSHAAKSDAMREEARKLLADGKVTRVLAWKRGDFEFDASPAFFYRADELDDFIYNKYCTSLSKYMIKAAKEEGVTLVFLRPCDFRQFDKNESPTCKNKPHIIEIECEPNPGLERCQVCTEIPESKNKLAGVIELETKTNDERFEFWRGELSRCIRCNACRNACPACTCKKCVFEPQKANVTPFEEQMFHIIRSHHVAGKCADCGECTRVCPQDIPLHYLSRKIIKEIDELDGEYV